MSGFHEELTLRRRRLPPAIVDAVESGEVLGEGTFARVYALAPHLALKLTACPASVRLLRRLQACTQRNRAVPGLPLVFTYLGRMADGPRGAYCGFVMERLFKSTRSLVAAAARAAIWPLYRQHRGIDERPPAHKLNRRSLVRLVAAIRERHRRLDADGHSRRATAAALASELASMTDHPLMEAFDFLEEFVVRDGFDLDVVQPGNLLFNAFGEPMLADPVAPLFDEQDLRLEPRPPRYAVVGLLPVRRTGLTVACRWDTLAVADCMQSAQAEARASRRGLVEVEVLPYRSARHLHRLRQRVAEVEVYRTPFWKGARHARTD